MSYRRCGFFFIGTAFTLFVGVALLLENSAFSRSAHKPFKVRTILNHLPLERMTPESEIPDDPSAFVWEVVAFDPKAKAVPTYRFDSFGYRIAKGEVPVGIQFVPEYVRLYNRKHHFGTKDPQTRELLWLPGQYLKIVKRKPTDKSLARSPGQSP